MPPVVPDEPKPDPATIERAKQRVQATQEYRWLDANSNVGVEAEAAPTCAKPDCDVRVTVRVGDVTYYSFLFHPDGSLAVELPGAIVEPYEAWSPAEQKRLAALGKTLGRLGAKIAKLPETKALFRHVTANGGTPTLWPDGLPPPGCTAADDDCVFTFYVGELMNGHANRWWTFRIAVHGEAIRVMGMDQPDPEPYATWRKRKYF